MGASTVASAQATRPHVAGASAPQVALDRRPLEAAEIAELEDMVRLAKEAEGAHDDDDDIGGGEEEEVDERLGPIPECDAALDALEREPTDVEESDDELPDLADADLAEAAQGHGTPSGLAARSWDWAAPVEGIRLDFKGEQPPKVAAAPVPAEKTALEK